MIRAWRLTRRAHATPAPAAFRGTGAERYGGRWNTVGIAAVYVSSSRSLAALEYLANLDPDALPDDLVFLGCAFDEGKVRKAKPPLGWDAADPVAAQRYGDVWLRSHETLALAVPSVLIPAETNYVLNPARRDIRSVHIERKAESFRFDSRLLRR